MYVTFFKDGNASEANLLGGKGANLAEMKNLGMPVPDGVTITTAAYTQWASLSDEAERAGFVLKLVSDVLTRIDYLFPDGRPLLSVRSGARVSMPGMMDTILNVGVSSETLDYWSSQLGERTALDCYRRFLQMFGSTALGIAHSRFEYRLKKVKSCKYGQKTAPKFDSDMSVVHYKTLIARYEALIESETQHTSFKFGWVLAQCITAVFSSWNSDRAKAYRAKYGYPDDWGTAVNIQQMVFGNKNANSCSGVLFSRCPSTGKNEWTGEFLVNAQGEDVVAGIRTPKSLLDMPKWSDQIYNQLFALVTKLETHYKDMQDVEFTVEDGKLYLLQTRSGKRSAQAAFKIAHDMLVTEGMITEDEALSRVTASQYLALKRPSIAPDFDVPPDFVGLPASSGIATGVVVKSSVAAVTSSVPCVLVSRETSPDDFSGMEASVGILTATGGATSHAAVVARGMDKVCVVGCSDLPLEDINDGDTVTIDGGTGRVWFNKEVPVTTGSVSPEAQVILDLAFARAENSSVLIKSVEDVTSPTGTFFIDGSELEDAELTEILTKLSPSSRVFLDLRGSVTAGEREFLDLLGLDKGSKKLDLSVLTKFSFSEQRVRVPSDITVPSAVLDTWSVVKDIASWDDLLSPKISGPLTIALHDKLMADGVPVSKLLQFLKDQGKKFEDLSEIGMPIARKLFEVLGQ